MRSLPLLMLAAALSAGALPAQAQERMEDDGDRVAMLDLPEDVAEEVISFFNAPETIHFNGRSRVPADRVIEGDVAVLGGPFTVAGRIEGRVVVINGAVELLPGSEIAGDLLVVGGTIEGVERARVTGEIRTYGESLRYRRRGERIARAEPRRARERREGEGRSEFRIATGQSYNRVEGLPITFGPVVETEGRNPLRLRALAIYRTESGLSLDTDRLGYYVRADQFLGGHRALRVGGSAFSLVDPIEDWHVSDLENGLSTFLFHRDFRDHYEREGWSVFATVSPVGSPLSLTAEHRRERHGSLPAGSPWALFGNSEEWRPQPLAAEGSLSSVVLRGTLDTRSDREDPATGWLVSGEMERAYDADLSRPAAVGVAPGADGPEYFPAVSYSSFTTGRLDLRRYNRVSPSSRLNLRLLVGGSLTGDAVPPQRQHALGGEGSLPAYDLFRLDCGARSKRVFRGSTVGAQEPGEAAPPTFYPSYGCDGFALAQAEYRGALDFRFRWNTAPWGDPDDGYEDEDDGWDVDWASSPDWIVFVDAGRGWDRHGGASEGLVADLGFGFVFERLGVYLAVPLNEGGRVNLFARIGPRF